MSDNTHGSGTSIPVIPRTESEDERVFLELQKKDHAKLIKLTKLLRHTDDLEAKIYDIVHGIADNEFKPEDPPYDPETMQVIIESYFPIADVVTPEFLSRYAYPFQLLRIALGIYQLNPVSHHQLSNVRKTEAEKRNRALEQLVWFQFLVGATQEQVESNLQTLRQSKTDARVRLHACRNPIKQDLHSPESKFRPPKNAFGAQVAPRHYEPSDARAYHDDSYHGPVARATGSVNVDTGYNQSKKGYAVHSYFKDRQFTGAPEQSIDTLLRDYEICAEQQCLDPSQMSLFFVNALADPARQFFLNNCSTSMPFEDIASHMQRHYNSETRKLQNQSEMDSLELTSFMHKHGVTDLGDGLTKLVNHINALAPQLPAGFGDDAHKTRYMRRAVLGHSFAQQPIAQITSARYTFTQFTTALKESLQLKEELSRARAPEMNYGQYVRDPRDVRPSSSRWSHMRSIRSRNDRDRSRSPYRRDFRERSRSPFNPERDAHQNSQYGRRINPNVRNKKVCWGCGSPDHILSDRKCTPKLETIKTNITEHVGSSSSAIDDLAEEFVTLLARASQDTTDTIGAHVRSDEYSPQVHFDESVFNVDECNALESRFAAGFNNAPHDVQFVNTDRVSDTYDCSHVRPLSVPQPAAPPGFCVDIGAPKSVVGQLQLKEYLTVHRPLIHPAHAFNQYIPLRRCDRPNDRYGRNHARDPISGPRYSCAHGHSPS